MGPTPILDYLTPTMGGFIPLLHIMDPLEGVDGLDDMQRIMIKANHTTNLTALQGYHQKVSDSVRGLGLSRYLMTGYS